ncbi:MAG TPA: glycine cleavage T C-terminal barrel domain-containing protein [Thermoanaerobaculia bacterium]|nr:glycine cleavage T C-terminal barrel domain-containing protein [Thermoanaerobaculia bacterium]
MTSLTIEDQYRALREGCAVVERSWAGRIELLGADRQRFANAYLTCEVKSLAPGHGAYGFVTSAQGRILSDAVVLAQEDRLWLEVGPDQAGPITEHLKKFILADRVEVRSLEDMVPVALVGPRSTQVLGQILGSAADLPEGAWAHGRRMVLGTEVRLQRGGPSVPWGYTLWVSASIAPYLIESLVELDGVRQASLEALEILRVEKGLPRFGREYGPENFPQETGLEEAVSYTKGCYLGQEVVARIHYRGAVQKVMRGLVFEGEAPEPGASLVAEGREAGTVASVVRSPALDRTVGLTILHRRAAAPGTRLDVAGGGTAEVRELPW